jgi:hypothetical protein
MRVFYSNSTYALLISALLILLLTLDIIITNVAFSFVNRHVGKELHERYSDRNYLGFEMAKRACLYKA